MIDFDPSAPFAELEAFVEPKAEERAELIERLQRWDFSLSFSSLSKFAVSPYAFIAYKLQERKETPAMLLGNVVHCRLLEPDRFQDLYRIAPTVNAATADGKNAWGEIYEQMTGTELARNKQGNVVLPKLETVIAEIKAATGITVIPGRIAEDGDFRARRLLQNRASRWVIDQIGQTEHFLEMDLGGIRFTGRIDGLGEGMVMDIKNMPSAELRAATYQIKARRLHWQAWAYLKATGRKKYYVTCVDGNGEVSVHLIPERMIEQAEIEVLEYIDRFKDAVVQSSLFPEQDIWASSQDFWLTTNENPQGINIIT